MKPKAKRPTSKAAPADAGHLPRVDTGSVLDPAAVALFAGMLRGPHFKAQGNPEGWLKMLLPGLQSVADLLALAWDVLDGNPTAPGLLRKVLFGFAGGAEETKSFAKVGALFDPQTGGCLPCAREAAKGAKTPPSHPLAPHERLLPLLAATVMSARGPDELGRLLGAVEIGLGGLAELALLYDAGFSLPDPENRRFTSLAWDMAGRAATGRMGVGGLPFFGGFGPGGGNPFPGGFGPGGRPPAPGEGGGWPWPDFDFPPSPIPGPGSGGSPVPDPGGISDEPARIISLLDAFEICLFELIPRMNHSGRGIRLLFPEASGSYVIASVSPENLCAGATLELTGTGFDGTQEVRFTGVGSRPVGVAPSLLESTRIEVEVPAGAISGPVWLYIPERFPLCSGMSLTVARPGTPGTFVAGAARVRQFSIDAGACVVVGSPASLRWAVEPEDAAVEIWQRAPSGETRIFDGWGPAGSIDIDSSELGNHRFTIRVTNPHGGCPAASSTTTLSVDGPAPVLTILGVEVTQGIQRFSLAAPDDPTNNSLRMIRGKDTVVRVFVRSDRGGFAGDLARITGVLTVNGRRIMPMNSSPFVFAGPDPQRSNIDDSLNFLVPAAQAEGMGERLMINVFSTEGCPARASVTHFHTVDWHDLPPLPVTIRRISDPGTGDVVTEMEALDIVRTAFDRLPSTPAEVRVRPGEFTIHEGTTEANYCRDGGFYQLALSLAYEHNGVEGLSPDPHETVWIGLFFQSGCTAGGMMAWPWNSTCISRRDAEIAAHEMAHCVGRGHTPSGNGESCEDLFQPVACHRLPNNGRIDEVVFDIRANALELGAPDLMTYAPGFRFPHPDHWEAIRDGIDSFVAASAP